MPKNWLIVVYRLFQCKMNKSHATNVLKVSHIWNKGDNEDEKSYLFDIKIEHLQN